MGNELVEELAEYAHEAWSGWMKYMFSVGNIDEYGALILPSWSVKRWQRQMHTPYDELPESEKVSDRAEANKMIDIMNGPPEPDVDLTIAERL